jgi:hypothetical protein
MDFEKAFLVISVTLIIVILLNLGLYTLVKRRKNTVGEVELFRRAMNKARNPWEDEQAKLESLAKQVAELKKESSQGSSNHGG